MKSGSKKNKPEVRQEYLVQVTIIEARALKGNEDTGSCDPFVKISVSGQAPQVTVTKHKAANCVFNQSFTFTNIWMNQVELESFEIKIEVFDLMEFTSNRLIGQYSIGLSTLFRNPQHEIFNQWLRLTHPNEGIDPQGFLLCSAYIISAEDRPPVHDINENKVEEEPDEFGGKPDEELTGEELARRRAKKQQIAIVQRPEMMGKPYQLMVNIYKAENLPNLSFGKCDSFISVRAGGITQITPVMKSMQNPQYATRLMFPLYFPVFNDKIVIRVWDKRVCMTDNFIAMIPEIPSETDFFNANFLQSRGGVMPFRWFCLYGIPMNERPSNFEEKFLGYKKKHQGTDYMGRVCLSLNLTPSQKPEKTVKPLNTFKEPPIQMYICRVDFYEVQDAKDCGEQVFLQVRVGSTIIESEAARMKQESKRAAAAAKDKKAKDPKESQPEAGISYEWKDKQIIKKPDEKIELPQDGVQVPDVILSLLDEKKKRVAYLRIPYHHKDLETPKPMWYTLNCVKHKSTGDDGKGEIAHSFCLINVMLRPDNYFVGIPRIAVKRNVQAQYNLHCFVYAGYDLCPDCYSEEVEVEFEIKAPGFDQIKLTDRVKGKNPIWNKRFQSCGSLDENLEFASNIIVKFRNLKKDNGWFDDNTVGDICIQAMKCGIDTSQQQEFNINDFKPDYQFYHITNREGAPVGRILAAFHLEKLKKNQKGVNKSKGAVPLIQKEAFKPMQLQFSVFGARKTPTKFVDPVIFVRCPIPPEYKIVQEKKTKTEEEDPKQEEKVDDDFNPYYVSKMKTCVKPTESDGWFSAGIQDPNFLKLLKLNIWVPPDYKFWPQIEVELRERDKSDLKFLDKLESNIKDFRKTNERFIAGMSLISLAKERDMIKLSEAIRFFDEGKETQEEQGDKQIFGGGQDDKDGQKQEGQTEGGEEGEAKQAEAAPTKQKKHDQDSVTGVDQTIRNKLQSKSVANVLVDQLIEIEITQEDQETMKYRTNWKKEALKYLLGQTKGVPQYEQIKAHVKREMEMLKSGSNINDKPTDDSLFEDKFFGMQKDDDDEGGGAYDYGRKTLKGPYEEEIKKQIPFKRFPLYRLSKTKNGIMGNPTNSFIKGDIKLVPLGGSLKPTIKKSSKYSQRKDGKKDQDAMAKYKFNLFDKNFLRFFENNFPVKVRVYLLRGLNLAAQSQNIDTKHMLAGLNALCEANPFPEIIVGERTSADSGLIKYVNDQDKAVLNTLSPEFYRMHELDAQMPKDWKMIINIKDRGMFNNMIGQVEIDLEDRFVGETTLKERISFMVYQKIFEKELEDLKFKYTAEDEQRKKLLQGQITQLKQQIDTFDKDRYTIPVEYCELKKSGAQQTSQGTVEMWIEVLPIDLAREIPPSPLSRPAPQEYEVRFIILETQNIPRNPNKNNVVDIFVKAAMDATATGLDKEVEKETDTHNGSTDGAGQFNYRMKFPFIWPCPFPRIKLSVYDMNAFTADESIGEATVSLRRVTNRLSTDGKYDMPPTLVKISHPNFPDSDRGEVLIQINIVTKAIADANPVGDAQEEPNQDPFLERPTAGRGLADFFKSAGGGRGFMFYVKVIGGIVVLLLVVVVLFVKPGILVN